MKKVLILFVVLAFGLILNAQKRENVKKVTSFASKSEKLMSAKTVRWIFDSTSGKWNDSNGGSYFKYLQFAKFIKENKTYYVLLYKHTDGAYEYPSIKSGFYTFKKESFIIFTFEQYSKFKKAINLQSGKNVIISNKLNGYKTGSSYTESDLLNDIEKRIEKGESNYSKEEFIINSQIIDGKNIIRFETPNRYTINKTLKSTYLEVDKSEFDKLFNPLK